MTKPGIFTVLKQTKDPIVLKELNKYIKFSTQPTEANVAIGFLEQCIDRSEFPKQYWTILRRNRINITRTSLQRLALNEKDTWLSRVYDLDHKRTVAEGILTQLTPSEANEFENYVHQIMAERREKKTLKLRRQLNPIKPRVEFPRNPERYIGRTTRRLSERIREHQPVWLTRGSTRPCSSAVATHLIESNHLINQTESFRPIYRIC
ncbi:uncharacterized protein DEA37_0006102, partial [Paragonimus westermani]